MEFMPCFHAYKLWVICEGTWNSQHCELQGGPEGVRFEAYFPQSAPPACRLPEGVGCLRTFDYWYCVERYSLYEIQGIHVKTKYFFSK